MHYGGNHWTNAQIAGLEDEFARYHSEAPASVADLHND